MNSGLHFNKTPLSEYFKFGLSVDCVIFGHTQGKVKVMLVKRGAEPFKDSWGIPGDLVRVDETFEEATNRILKELTGIENVYLSQLQAFGALDRHSDGRVVTVAYFALVPLKDFNPAASSWVSEVKWRDIHNVGALAFDHNDIYNFALKHLQENFRNSFQLGFKLLPEKFTLLEFHRLTEYILNEGVDKANFRKKILTSELIEPLDEIQKNVSHRPAKLFQVRKKIRKKI